MLADTITLRDMYKKHHWQVVGPTFNQLHLLYDKHYEEQSELVDSLAERIQLLGGIALAMAADIAEETKIPRPPRGREPAAVQLSRLIDAHTLIIKEAREEAEKASDERRLGHRRPAGQRGAAHQRAAGLVPVRAPGRGDAGLIRRASAGHLGRTGAKRPRGVDRERGRCSAITPARCRQP